MSKSQHHQTNQTENTPLLKTTGSDKNTTDTQSYKTNDPLPSKTAAINQSKDTPHLSQKLLSNQNSSNMTDNDPNIDNRELVAESSSPDNSLNGNNNGKSSNVNINIPNNNNNSNPDEVKEDTFYTKRAHLARRFYHVLTFTLIPVLWYTVMRDLSDALDLHASKILSIIIIVSICGEYIRIRKGFIFWGLREYERHNICANAWGAVSSALVLMLAYPRTFSIGKVHNFDNDSGNQSANFACNGQIAIPIIWSLGFGDPLLGELKVLARKEIISWRVMYFIAWMVIFIVWLMCWLWCDTPWFLMIIMPPVAILAERPTIPSIDDNGLMLLVPLLVALLLEPWFSRSCNPIFY